MEARQVFGSVENALANRKRIAFCTQCGSKTEERLVWGEPRSVCTACGYRDSARPAPAVAVVVVRDGQVLLCKRMPGMAFGGLWCLPSGGIEFDEDFLTAGRRETLEETGVEVEITSIISVVSNFWDQGNHTVVPVLLAEPLAGEPRPTSESQDAAWFRPDDLPDLAFEADRHIIERYFATRLAGVPVDLDYARHDAPGAARVESAPPSSRYPA
jgi:ADP-ribose pyrophosphatase YjhB (NUDIX family)